MGDTSFNLQNVKSDVIEKPSPLVVNKDNETINTDIAGLDVNGTTSTLPNKINDNDNLIVDVNNTTPNIETTTTTTTTTTTSMTNDYNYKRKQERDAKAKVNEFPVRKKSINSFSLWMYVPVLDDIKTMGLFVLFSNCSALSPSFNAKDVNNNNQYNSNTNAISKTESLVSVTRLPKAWVIQDKSKNEQQSQHLMLIQ